jgi:hypothetical protein
MHQLTAFELRFQSLRMLRLSCDAGPVQGHIDFGSPPCQEDETADDGAE